MDREPIHADGEVSEDSRSPRGLILSPGGSTVQTEKEPQMPILSGTEQIPGNGAPPEGEDTDPRLSWSVILDAPEIGAFLKKTETARAKEYRGKVSSLLSTVMQARLGSPDGLPDVSAILQRGPATALRAGALADENESFRKAIDLITAPDNPAVMFALAAIPLVMQVFRNHEGQLQDARASRAVKKTLTPAEKKAAKTARPRVEFTFLGRTWRLPFRFKLNLGSTLRMNTMQPEYLVSSVIGDPKIRSELSKRYGVKWDAAPADH